MLSIEDLKQIAESFNLKFSDEMMYRVADGYVREGDLVWWHGEEGPERIPVTKKNGMLSNLIEFPEIHSIKEPICQEQTKYVYTGEYKYE